MILIASGEQRSVYRSWKTFRCLEAGVDPVYERVEFRDYRDCRPQGRKEIAKAIRNLPGPVMSRTDKPVASRRVWPVVLQTIGVLVVLGQARWFGSSSDSLWGAPHRCA